VLEVLQLFSLTTAKDVTNQQILERVLESLKHDTVKF